MPKQYLFALLLSSDTSVSATGLIHPGGDSYATAKLLAENPSVIHLMPYDEANWQSLMESVEEWGRREEI